MKNIKSYISPIVLFLFTWFGLAQSKVITEEFLLKNDSIRLPGTLSYNDNLEQQPLAIYIHGSGPVDRNGNQGPQMQPNYIKQLSDSLVKRGIAFYRYDKRSATMSNFMSLKTMEDIKRELVFDKMVEDLNLAINTFKVDNRFSEIILIGHSQGSLIGMLASHEHISKYISLAGPSQPFDETIVKQMKLKVGDSIGNIMANHFKELKTTGKIVKVDSDQTISMIFSKPNLPFLLSWAIYNPSEEIKKVKIPTLIINGTIDNQVYKEDALNLYKAKPDAELILIDGMNHVLKTVTKEEDIERSKLVPDFPLSKKLVEAIEVFIKK